MVTDFTNFYFIFNMHAFHVLFFYFVLARLFQYCSITVVNNGESRRSFPLLKFRWKALNLPSLSMLSLSCFFFFLNRCSLTGSGDSLLFQFFLKFFFLLNHEWCSLFIRFYMCLFISGPTVLLYFLYSDTLLFGNLKYLGKDSPSQG